VNTGHSPLAILDSSQPKAKICWFRAEHFLLNRFLFASAFANVTKLRRR
jgi:hypothetical protein